MNDKIKEVCERKLIMKIMDEVLQRDSHDGYINIDRFKEAFVEELRESRKHLSLIEKEYHISDVITLSALTKLKDMAGKITLEEIQFRRLIKKAVDTGKSDESKAMIETIESMDTDDYVTIESFKQHVIEKLKGERHE